MAPSLPTPVTVTDDDDDHDHATVVADPRRHSPVDHDVVALPRDEIDDGGPATVKKRVAEGTPGSAVKRLAAADGETIEIGCGRRSVCEALKKSPAGGSLLFAPVPAIPRAAAVMQASEGLAAAS